MLKPKVICVVGPTATGKSDLGVYLAERVHGEVISADSMQVYKGMDIGTAKLTTSEMRGVPHHLIDIVNPDESFTVADWTKLADVCIQDVVARGKIPIVVGGTGLYVRAVTEDLDFGVTAGSPEIRTKWEEYRLQYGKAMLHDALRERDAESAQRLHVNDTRRVIRALEVYDTRGLPMSHTYAWEDKGGRYDTLQVARTYPRSVLYERVNQRVDTMLSNGLVHEVERLLAVGYAPNLTALQAIGYKEIINDMLAGWARTDAVDKIKQNTRRFVKRQESWFRRDARIHWFTDTTGGNLRETLYLDVLKCVFSFLAGIPAERNE